MPSAWGLTPRESIDAACARRGRDFVIDGCVDLLSRGEPDADLLRSLAGPHADYVLAGHEGGPDGYWPRVWAARGLLHAWDDRATDAIVKASRDEAWRVREMAAKVVARHGVGAALSAMENLRNDENARVRKAAERAVQMLVERGD